MLTKPDLDYEILLEDVECERMSSDWDVLNKQQAKAYKAADQGDNNNKSTKEFLKEYGVSKYEWDNWKKTHDKHINRYNQLIGIRAFVDNDRLPARIEKARGVEY